jgi:DNA polymerase
MSKKEVFEKITIYIGKCKKCNLYKTSKRPVIGNGSYDAKILFIGESPGFNEDLQGKPFVGKAGVILNELLESIGLKRNEVYIANILKCRPPNNRNPLKNEILACTEYLDKQINIIQPKIVVPLGNFASSFIFRKFNLTYDKISNIHGKIFKTKTVFSNIKIIPLFHPAVAIYNPKMKQTLIEDFKKLKQIVY